jgi:hypothetical protein
MDMERGKPPNILSRIEPTGSPGMNDNHASGVGT